MITRYEYKDDVLFLYMDYNYEFASFDKNIEKRMDIITNIKEYIKKMHLKLNSKYIVLVIGGIATLTLACSADTLKNNQFIPNPNLMEIVNYETYPSKPIIKEEKEIEEVVEPEKVENNKQEENPVVKPSQNNNSKPQQNTASKPQQNQTSKPVQNNSPSTNSSNTQSKPQTNQTKPSNSEQTKPTETKPTVKPEVNETMVTVYRSNGTVITLSLDEYLIGVVGGEMPASFNSEALKAQAIVARTYALNRIKEGKTLTDTVSTQVYRDNTQLKNTWGSSYNTYYSKIKNAVEGTKNMVLTYNGQYIDAVYHSTSNGYTVDAVDVWGKDIPYLKSVSSSYDLNASSYLRETTKELSTLSSILGLPIDTIQITKKDTHGRVQEVSVNDKVYSGVEFRNLLGLRSTDFDISINNGKVTFVTKGFGHGVGMSQYGANGMANAGYNYKDILLHYYQGVTLSTYHP